MKQLLKSLALVLIVAVSFTSCNKPSDPIDPDNPVNPVNPVNPDGPEGPGGEDAFTTTYSEIDLSGQGEKLQITITSKDDDNYTVSTDCDWIEIVWVENDVVTIRIKDNPDSEPRQGKLIVTDFSGHIMEIPVNQEGKPAPITGDGYTADYTLNTDVSIASEEFAEHISEADGYYIYLDKDTPKEQLPIIPSYIVVNTPTEALPNGLLAHLQGLETMPDGTYKVSYFPIGVTSAFKNLNVNVDGMDLDSYVTRVEDAEGNPVEFAKTKATESEDFHLEIPEVAWPIGGGFELTPKMSADIALKLQFIIADYSVSTFNVKVITDLNLGAELSIAAEELSLNYNLKLLSIYFAAIPVGPILLTPAVDIYAVAGISGKVSIVASTSTRVVMTASLHYDEINGTSGDFKCEEPVGEKEERTFGPKIEGGFQYGLGIGPKVGIYGDVISAGFTLDAKLEESISKTFQWSDLSFETMYSELDFSRQIMDIDYNYSFVAGATIHLSGFGFPWEKSFPDVKFPIHSRKLLPEVYDCTATVEGGQIVAKAKVRHPAIIYPNYKFHISNIVNWVEQDIYEAEFDFDDSAIKRLEDGEDYVEMTAELTIHDNTYFMTPPYVYMDVMHTENWLRAVEYPYSILAIDKACTDAIKAILSDIYSCRSGEWEGCNWLEPGVSVSACENVYVRELSPGKFNYRITIPESWELGSTLEVGNHTEGLDNFGEWGLIIKDKDLQMSKLHIYDDHLHWIEPCNTIDEYGLHGDCRFNGVVSTTNYGLPEEADVLDFSGFGADSFSVYDNMVSNPEKVILDNCEYLFLISYNAPNKESIPRISAKNCPKLRLVTISDMAVDKIDLSGIVLGDEQECVLKMRYATVEDGSSFEFGKWPFTKLELEYYNITDIDVSEAPNLKDILAYPSRQLNGNVIIKACPKLKKVSFYGSNMDGYLNSLSVTDCPVLEILRCSAMDLSSLEVSGVPNIQELSCSHNHNLTGEMLPVFDQMFEAGYYPEYDQRYDYYNGEMREDIGYGFYYPGEPERGYHRE